MEVIWYALRSCKCKAMENRGFQYLCDHLYSIQVFSDDLNKCAIVIVPLPLEMIFRCCI